MESKEIRNSRSPWPFPEGKESSILESAGPEVDPISDPELVSWRLEDLPVEVRLDLLRRIQIGWAVIDNVLQLKCKQKNPDDASRGDHRSVISLLVLFLILGALGFYFEDIIYFYIGLLPLMLVMYFFVETLFSSDRRFRYNEKNAQKLLELRYRWLANGFDQDDFDTIESMDKSFREETQIFRKWWSLITLRLLVETRSSHNLPDLESAPAWKFYCD
jgi:hypothetical protein